MGRFYIRVFRDGIPERIWGCGSRGENNQHYKDYLLNLLVNANLFGKQPHHYHGPTLGKRYRLELVKNRHGEKELYREIEIELDMPNGNMPASYTICVDVTYITEGFDPRVLVLPPDW